MEAYRNIQYHLATLDFVYKNGVKRFIIFMARTHYYTKVEKKKMFKMLQYLPCKKGKVAQKCDPFIFDLIAKMQTFFKGR